MIKLNTSFIVFSIYRFINFVRWLLVLYGNEMIIFYYWGHQQWNIKVLKFRPTSIFCSNMLSFFMVAFWKITKIDGHQYLPFLFSPLAHSKVYFPLNTPATNVEISTAIATIMTKSLRRDLGERLAAVNRSLLPLIESCSPRFASSRWIWFKEPEHGCRIYFTLKLRRTNFEPKWVALISVTC